MADASVAGLPNATGTVDVDVSGTVARITVQWRAPQAAVGQENRYVTDVVIPAPPPAAASDADHECAAHPLRRGFTLVELMVAVAWAWRWCWRWRR